MRNSKLVAIAAIVGTSFFGSMTKPTNAALVAASEGTFSLGEITHDNSTNGLYWLDLSFTLDQSYNSITPRLTTEGEHWFFSRKLLGDSFNILKYWRI